MKRLVIILMILILIYPLTACDEQNVQNDKPEIGIPTAEPPDGMFINLEKIYDNSTKFSYITLKADNRTKPYFDSNAEFPENMFIYETHTPHIDDVKMYGYMNENFEKLSKPISLSPNVFSLGLAVIDGEEGSYIVDNNFKKVNELPGGYAFFGDAIINVSWRTTPPSQIKMSIIDNTDSYLVPVEIDTGKTSDDGKVYAYGYKPASEYIISGNIDNGKFAIGPNFEAARPFFNGLAAVKQNGLWGYIDQSGNAAIDFQYDYAMDFFENSTFVMKDYWALIDSEGNQLTEFVIRYADEFYDDWSTVGYAEFVTVKKTGDTYDSHRTFNNYINTSGDNLWEVGKLNVTIVPFKNGIAHVFDSGQNYFFDVNGRNLFVGGFSRANDFSDGLLAVKKGTGARSWTYIDSSGLTAIDDRFISTGDFNHGYAFVIKDFVKPGYIIDKMGNKYLEDLNLYSMTKFNDEGYALGYTIVNKNETTQEWLYYMIHIEGN